MQLDEQRIQEIVDKVMARLGPEARSRGTPADAVVRAASFAKPAAAGPTPRGKEARIPRAQHGLFPDVDSAVAAARRAFEQYDSVPVATRERIIAAMRKVTMDNLRPLSEYAVAETGYGRVEDKLKKNELVALKTP